MEYIFSNFILPTVISIILLCWITNHCRYLLILVHSKCHKNNGLTTNKSSSDESRGQW